MLFLLEQIVGIYLSQIFHRIYENLCNLWEKF